MRRLRELLGGHAPPSPQRRRIVMNAMPNHVYAIGDVHGCFDLLRALEAQIVEDAAGRDGDKLVVMLGDYIDRGPRSREVLDHLMRRAPEGIERVCLAGNHEQVMSDFLDAPGRSRFWLGLGGTDTLASYGIDISRVARPGSRAFGYVLDSHIPQEHIDFLRELPVMLTMPGWVFVHAGVRPQVPLADQDEDDLLWIRDEFLHAGALGIGRRVVHGHTPAADAEDRGDRIGIDTGAYQTGRLTAVRITPTGDVSFLQTK